MAYSLSGLSIPMFGLFLHRANTNLYVSKEPDRNKQCIIISGLYCIGKALHLETLYHKRVHKNQVQNPTFVARSAPRKVKGALEKNLGKEGRVTTWLKWCLLFGCNTSTK